MNLSNFATTLLTQPLASGPLIHCKKKYFEDLLSQQFFFFLSNQLK